LISKDRGSEDTKENLNLSNQASISFNTHNYQQLNLKTVTNAKDSSVYFYSGHTTKISSIRGIVGKNSQNVSESFNGNQKLTSPLLITKQ
jgi:hypothetical protein